MHYHDNKTSHTSPQNYRDMDGNMRTFTMVDHDPKTKIAVPTTGTDPVEEVAKYRETLIGKILDIPAVYAATPHWVYTIRGEQVDGIVKWNENMLRDKGTPLNLLNEIYTLSSNVSESRSRFTV